MWPRSVCGSVAPLSSRGICAPLTATEGKAGHLVHSGSSLHLFQHLDLRPWGPESSCERKSHLKCNWHHQVWRLFGGNKCARVVPQYGFRCVPCCVPDHRQTLAHNFHPVDDKDKIYDLLHGSWIDRNLFDQHSVQLWTFLLMLQFSVVRCSITLISENINISKVERPEKELLMLIHTMGKLVNLYVTWKIPPMAARSKWCLSCQLSDRNLGVGQRVFPGLPVSFHVILKKMK